MNVLPVLEFLRQKIGLNPDSIGSALVEKSIRERLKMSGAANIDDYLKIISGSPAELKQLVESVVISETSFFRNRVPFVTLKSYLKRFVLNRKRESPIRILCLPCSTGEESYSIAMALFDIKIPPGQFYIFAGDISEKALQFAQAGIYSDYSFRGDDLDFRKTYFSKQDDSYILNKEVRDTVHFEQVNILADNFLPGHKPYDIIFCRNLLIYFDDDSKEKAIKALSSRLSDEGVLFVGHAEGAKIPQYGFLSLDYPMSFAFAREKYAITINTGLNPGYTPSKAFALPAPVAFPAIPARPASAPIKAPPVIANPDSHVEKKEAARKYPDEGGIEQARQLAEAGAFNEVLTICEKLLSEGAESAEVYYLLGQAGEAAGNSLMAEEYFKKAIYLNADFYEALVHLSRLYDQMGNPEKAVAFRKRAGRVKSRNSSEV